MLSQAAEDYKIILNIHSVAQSTHNGTSFKIDKNFYQHCITDSLKVNLFKSCFCNEKLAGVNDKCLAKLPE